MRKGAKVISQDSLGPLNRCTEGQRAGATTAPFSRTQECGKRGTRVPEPPTLTVTQLCRSVRCAPSPLRTQSGRNKRGRSNCSCTLSQKTTALTTPESRMLALASHRSAGQCPRAGIAELGAGLPGRGWGCSWAWGVLALGSAPRAFEQNCPVL